MEPEPNDVRSDVGVTCLSVRRPSARSLAWYGVPLAPARDAVQALPRKPHGDPVGREDCGFDGDCHDMPHSRLQRITKGPGR